MAFMKSKIKQVLHFLLIVCIVLSDFPAVPTASAAAPNLDFGNASIQPYKDPAEAPTKRFAVGFMSYETWPKDNGGWTNAAPDTGNPIPISYTYSFTFTDRTVSNVKVYTINETSKAKLYFNESRASSSGEGDYRLYSPFFSEIDSISQGTISGKGTSTAKIPVTINGLLQTANAYRIQCTMSTCGTEKTGYRFYFPVVFEFELDGLLTTKPFTRSGDSLGSGTSKSMQSGNSYTTSVPNISNYTYVGYKEIIDGKPGSFIESTSPPPAIHYDGSYDEKQINLYYESNAAAGTIHVRHMVRKSSSGSFSQSSESSISVKTLPDTRTVTPDTSYGTVVGSSLSYSSYSNTVSGSKTVTTSLKTGQEEAWVTFFYENSSDVPADPGSVTASFDILPGNVINNGDSFTLRPKDFQLKSCTYQSHRYKIVGPDGQTYFTPNVYGMTTDSMYTADTYPPVIKYDSLHTIFIQVFSSCGSTGWLSPQTLQLTSQPPPPGPSGPVAVITGPSRVKAGQPLPYPITGERSWDWQDKPIVSYTWDHHVVQTDPVYNVQKYDTPGTYTITLNVKNSAGVLSDEATHQIEVVPNDPPVALLLVPPEDTRLGTAIIKSKSFSPDGDAIVSYKFEMKYDANNNGFSDDAWQTLQEGDSDTYTFRNPSRVGKYLFRLTACETGNICGTSDTQTESERTLNILNLEPTANVKTSSPVTESDTRKPLTMDELYNSGTIASLGTGATGDKSGWVLQGGNLSTKSYKSDFGMFNENFGADDKYYGEDFVNRTLYASLQNNPTVSLLGTYDRNTIFFADEKYVYSVGRGSTTSTAVLTSYDKQLNVRWQKTWTMANNHGVVASDSETITSVMVKGDRIYLLVRATSLSFIGSKFDPYTYIFNRENGDLVAGPLNIGDRMQDTVNSTMYYFNNFYADSKGLIANTQPGSSYDCSTSLCRISYDLSSSEDYYGYFDISERYRKMPFYISQNNQSIYYKSNSGADWVTYNNLTLAEQSVLEFPFATYWQNSDGSTRLHLIGVDDTGNYYSSIEYLGKVYIVVHNSAGQVIRQFEVPSYLQYIETVGTPVAYYEYFLDPRNPYTVDGKGNIWTADSGVAYVMTPAGDIKNLYTLSTDKGTATNQVIAILNGSDGLVTYISLFHPTSTSAPQLEFVTFDPDTYLVVNHSVSGTTISADGRSGKVTTKDANHPDAKMYPLNVIPIGDQTYLIQGYAYSDSSTYKSNLYLVKATGALTYPKAYDIGTPSSDVWIGSVIPEGYSFQGDLKPSTASTAGAGYVYLAQDAKNYYSAEFEGGQLKVKKTVNGTAATVFSKSFALVAGQTYSVRFVPESGGFSVYVNKVKQATIAETGWTSGKFGVISRGQPGVTFTNAFTEVSGQKIGSITGVALVGQVIEYDVTFDDPEGDPRISAGETWTYTHNPNVFLQPQGIWSESGKSVKAPVMSFPLPGEYTFKFKTKDDPIPDYPYPSSVFAGYRKESNEVTGTIRVHRRPVAVPGVTVGSDQSISYTDNSYDPDRYDPATGAYSTENTGIDYRSNHGIIDRHWRYRLKNSDVYTDGQPKKLSKGNYVFELNVTDEYGADSGWVAVDVTVNGIVAQPPIPGFTVTPATSYRNVDFTIDSTARDPQDGGRENLIHQYYIKNLTTNGPEYETPSTRTTWTRRFSEGGAFQIRQVVTNSFGLSAQAIHTVTVINRKPMVTVTTPASADPNNPAMLNSLRPQFIWSFTDADGDFQSSYQVKVYRYNGASQAATLLQDYGVKSGNVRTLTATSDLPQNQTLFVIVQASDGQPDGLSDWSAPKYFKVRNVYPPVAGFTVTPTTTYRGVPVTIDSTASDPQDGDRTNLAHAYYIRNATAGDAETLQSNVRTTWTKAFSSLGTMQIRQVVTNSVGLSAEATHTVTVVNRKPAGEVITPASTSPSSPTQFTTQRPTFQWTYTDADGDPQSKVDLRIYSVNQSDPILSATVTGTGTSWTPNVDLPRGPVMYIRILVYDAYDGAEKWSEPKYFRLNQPPTGDFNWSPALIYEGDRVVFQTAVDDPDRDTLDVTYEIESPSGTKETFRYTLSYPYASTGPTLTSDVPGVWTATLKVSDRIAPEVVKSKTFRVWPLGLTGQVRHTDEWEANRLHYNAEHPGAERPAHWFWAGEAFVLDALATDTGTSTTKAVRIVADAGGGLRKALKPTNAPVMSVWTETLGSKDAGFELKDLPEGNYTFVFTVTYSNGVVKTAQATIRIQDTVDDYVGVHRIR